MYLHDLFIGLQVSFFIFLIGSFGIIRFICVCLKHLKQIWKDLLILSIYNGLCYAFEVDSKLKYRICIKSG